MVMVRVSVNRVRVRMQMENSTYTLFKHGNYLLCALGPLEASVLGGKTPALDGKVRGLPTTGPIWKKTAKRFVPAFCYRMLHHLVSWFEAFMTFRFIIALVIFSS